jgi:hypothetical protein
MILSDTALRILTAASRHPLLLAAPPKQLPAAASQTVLRNLLKQSYVEECAAAIEHAGPGWRDKECAWAMVRVTDAGLRAIGVEAAPACTATEEAAVVGLPEAERDAERASAECAPNDGIDLIAPDAREQTIAAGMPPGDAAQELSSAPLAASAAECHEAPAGDNAPHQASTAVLVSTRATFRDAAQRVVAAWDDELAERSGLPHAIAHLRFLLAKAAPAPRAAAPGQPREETKQQQVLAMLHQPEGTTVASPATASMSPC